jgi:CHAD domain-containing protein
MAFRFEIRETFLKAIPRIARERIDRVIKSLNEKPQPGAESIHEARKDLKSLRALLRLARGSIDREVRRRENISFREIGRLLSTVRDPQALLEALEYVAKENRSNSDSSTPKQESMRAFIHKIRGEIEQNLVDGLPQGAVKKLVRELRDARRRVALLFEGVPMQPENEWEMFVGAGLRQTYRKAKNLVWQFEMMGHETGGDEAWHELRKCAKALGYQLRLFKPTWNGMVSELVDEIDHLTDRLGDANDLAILLRKILSEPYDPSEAQTSGEMRRILLQSLVRRKQLLQWEAFKLARLIYAEKPGQFERRIAAYWQIWRSQSEVKDTRSFSNIDRQAGGQGRPRRKTRPKILAPSPS